MSDDDDGVSDPEDAIAAEIADDPDIGTTELIALVSEWRDRHPGVVAHYVKHGFRGIEVTVIFPTAEKPETKYFLLPLPFIPGAPP